MNRRQFLQAMGLASGSLFLPSLGPSRAWAESGVPQRLIVFYTQHGTWHEGWKIHPEGKPTDAFWEADLSGMSSDEFSTCLRPLHAFRDRMLMVDGLGLVSAETDQSNLRHEKGQVHSLTGSNISMVGGLPLASMPSIDQRIAGIIGREDRWKSLEIGVGEPPISVVYAGQNQLLPFQTRPEVLYQRLFDATGLVATGVEGITPVGGRASMLQASQAQFAALKSRLSPEDAAKLGVHEGLLESIEKRVQGLTTLSCGAIPERPESEGYEADYQAFIPLITAALSCDMTRVISVHMGEMSKKEVLGTVGGIHDEYAHNVYANPEAADVMTQYTATHSRHLADLLTALDSVPEGNGTLLDNTVVAWVGELGDGSHGFDRWPALLFGGGPFRYGRVLHYPRETPVIGQSWNGYEKMGVPHQKFLTSLCQGMGLDVDRMPVESVYGSSGQKVDCTGPLEGMV